MISPFQYIMIVLKNFWNNNSRRTRQAFQKRALYYYSGSATSCVLASMRSVRKPLSNWKLASSTSPSLHQYSNSSRETEALPWDFSFFHPGQVAPPKRAYLVFMTLIRCQLPHLADRLLYLCGSTLLPSKHSLLEYEMAACDEYQDWTN